MGRSDRSARGKGRKRKGIWVRTQPTGTHRHAETDTHTRSPDSFPRKLSAAGGRSRTRIRSGERAFRSWISPSRFVSHGRFPRGDHRAREKFTEIRASDREATTRVLPVAISRVLTNPGLSNLNSKLCYLFLFRGTWPCHGEDDGGKDRLPLPRSLFVLPVPFPLSLRSIFRLLKIQFFARCDRTIPRRDYFGAGSRGSLRVVESPRDREHGAAEILRAGYTRDYH